jgi:hypothetical protein
MRLQVNGAVPHLCRWGIGSGEVVALQFAAGRIGLGENPPPQFGQTFSSTCSTHALQNVHSKLHIIASPASGGSALLQCSQVGLSSSAIAVS